MYMFSGSKLHGKSTQKGGGFRVKSALQRKGKGRPTSTLASKAKAAGSRGAGRAQGRGTVDPNSHSLSWFSRENAERPADGGVHGGQARGELLKPGEIAGPASSALHGPLTEYLSPTYLSSQTNERLKSLKATTIDGESKRAGADISRNQVHELLSSDPTASRAVLNVRYEAQVKKNLMQRQARQGHAGEDAAGHHQTFQPGQSLRDVQATQPDPEEIEQNMNQVMDNPPVYIEIQGSKASGQSAEDHNDDLNTRNFNKSRASSPDLNDREENAEKPDQSFKQRSSQRKQSMAAQQLEEQKQRYVLDRNCSKSLVLNNYLLPEDEISKVGERAQVPAELAEANAQGSPRANNRYKNAQLHRNAARANQRSELVPAATAGLSGHRETTLFNRRSPGTVTSKSEQLKARFHRTTNPVAGSGKFNVGVARKRVTSFDQQESGTKLISDRGGADSGTRQAQALSDKTEVELKKDGGKGAFGALEKTRAKGRTRPKSLQHSQSKQTIDPDLIKFYEAFKNQRSLTKMPIKPPRVDFRRDLDKLKRVSNEMRETMLRVQLEKMNSSHKDAQMECIVQEFREYQAQHGLGGDQEAGRGRGTRHRALGAAGESLKSAEGKDDKSEDAAPPSNPKQHSSERPKRVDGETQTVSARKYSQIQSKLNSRTVLTRKRSTNGGSAQPAAYNGATSRSPDQPIADSKRSTLQNKYRTVNELKAGRKSQDRARAGQEEDVAVSFNMLHNISVSTSRQRLLRDSRKGQRMSTGKLQTVSVHEIDQKKSNDDIRNLIIAPSAQEAVDVQRKGQSQHSVAPASVPEPDIIVIEYGEADQDAGDCAQAQDAEDVLQDALQNQPEKADTDPPSTSARQMALTEVKRPDVVSVRSGNQGEIQHQEQNAKITHEISTQNDGTVSKTAEAGKEVAEGAAGEQPRLDVNDNTLVAIFVDGQEDPIRLSEEQASAYNTMQPENDFKDQHPGADAREGLILKIMNTSDAANSYQASAFFQNDVISQIDVQNQDQVHQDQDGKQSATPGHPVAVDISNLNGTGSLVKMATASYSKGSWQNASNDIGNLENANRRTSLKQEYYRYPNPVEGEQSKHSHKRQYSVQPPNKSASFRVSEHEEPPTIALNAHAAAIDYQYDPQLIKQDYSKIEQKIQGKVNRPLLESKGMYSTALQRQAIESLLQRQNLPASYVDAATRLHFELYDAKNFEYTTKGGLSHISELEPTSGRAQQLGSPVASIRSKNSVKSRSRKGRSGTLRNSCRESNKRDVGAGGTLNFQQDPVITVQAPSPSAKVYSGLTSLVEQGQQQPRLLTIPNLDLLQQRDIELALQYEAAQRHYLNAAGSIEEDRFKNFKGDLKRVMQEAEEKRALLEQPPGGRPALYTRLSSYSGKTHLDNLKTIKERKARDNRQQESSLPARQMMKLQVQFAVAEEPLQKMRDESELQLNSQMSAFQHRVMNKQQPYHLILRAKSKSSINFVRSKADSRSHSLLRSKVLATKSSLSNDRLSLRSPKQASPKISQHLLSGTQTMLAPSAQSHGASRHLTAPGALSHQRLGKKENLVSTSAALQAGKLVATGQGVPLGPSRASGGTSGVAIEAEDQQVRSLQQLNSNTSQASQPGAKQNTPGPGSHAAQSQSLIAAAGDVYYDDAGGVHRQNRVTTPGAARQGPGQVASPMGRAMEGQAAASLNRFNPSIRSMNTINSDQADGASKLAPRSIYKDKPSNAHLLIENNLHVKSPSSVDETSPGKPIQPVDALAGDQADKGGKAQGVTQDHSKANATTSKQQVYSSHFKKQPSGAVENVRGAGQEHDRLLLQGQQETAGTGTPLDVEIRSAAGMRPTMQPRHYDVSCRQRPEIETEIAEDPDSVTQNLTSTSRLAGGSKSSCIVERVPDPSSAALAKGPAESTAMKPLLVGEAAHAPAANVAAFLNQSEVLPANAPAEAQQAAPTEHPESSPELKPDTIADLDRSRSNNRRAHTVQEARDEIKGHSTEQDTTEIAKEESQSKDASYRPHMAMKLGGSLEYGSAPISIASLEQQGYQDDGRANEARQSSHAAANAHAGTRTWSRQLPKRQTKRYGGHLDQPGEVQLLTVECSDVRRQQEEQASEQGPRQSTLSTQMVEFNGGIRRDMPHQIKDGKITVHYEQDDYGFQRELQKMLGIPVARQASAVTRKNGTQGHRKLVQNVTNKRPTSSSTAVLERRRSSLRKKALNHKDRASLRGKPLIEKLKAETEERREKHRNIQRKSKKGRGLLDLLSGVDLAPDTRQDLQYAPLQDLAMSIEVYPYSKDTLQQERMLQNLHSSLRGQADGSLSGLLPPKKSTTTVDADARSNRSPQNLIQEMSVTSSINQSQQPATAPAHRTTDTDAFAVALSAAKLKRPTRQDMLDPDSAAVAAEDSDSIVPQAVPWIRPISQPRRSTAAYGRRPGTNINIFNHGNRPNSSKVGTLQSTKKPGAGWTGTVFTSLTSTMGPHVIGRKTIGAPETDASTLGGLSGTSAALSGAIRVSKGSAAVRQRPLSNQQHHQAGSITDTQRARPQREGQRSRLLGPKLGRQAGLQNHAGHGALATANLTSVHRESIDQQDRRALHRFGKNPVLHETMHDAIDQPGQFHGREADYQSLPDSRYSLGQAGDLRHSAKNDRMLTSHKLEQQKAALQLEHFVDKPIEGQDKKQPKTLHEKVKLGSRKDPRVASATTAGSVSRGVGSVGIKHVLSDGRHVGGTEHRAAANRSDAEPSEAGNGAQNATAHLRRHLKAPEDDANNVGLQPALRGRSQQQVRDDGHAGSGKDDYTYEGSRQLGSTTVNASFVHPSNASALYLEQRPKHAHNASQPLDADGTGATTSQNQIAGDGQNTQAAESSNLFQSRERTLSGKTQASVALTAPSGEHQRQIGVRLPPEARRPLRVAKSGTHSRFLAKALGNTGQPRRPSGQPAANEAL